MLSEIFFQVLKLPIDNRFFDAPADRRRSFKYPSKENPLEKLETAFQTRFRTLGCFHVAVPLPPLR